MKLLDLLGLLLVFVGSVVGWYVILHDFLHEMGVF
jgi:hypothetical protein